MTHSALSIHSLNARPSAALQVRMASGTARHPGVCTDCPVRDHCLPACLAASELRRVEALFHVPERVLRGRFLYRAGQSCRAIYAIRSGSIKISVDSESGREHVTGFHMGGDLIGLDGIASGEYACNAVALENSEVCVMPLHMLEELAVEAPTVQRRFHQMMSRALVRDMGVVTLLGSMRTERRLAAFLLHLSKRFAALGASPSRFHLHMTREEIGSYLGMTHETVSRAIFRLQQLGLVKLSQRSVQLVNISALNKLVHPMRVDRHCRSAISGIADARDERGNPATCEVAPMPLSGDASRHDVTEPLLERLPTDVRHFSDDCAGHMDREERRLFPLAIQ